MKKIDISFVFLSILLAGICYISTSSFIYPIIVLFLSLSNYFLLMRKQFKKYFSLIERVHTSYHFINSFVITLSVKDSLEDAYQNGIRLNNERLNLETDHLKEMPVINRIKYLKDYFNLSIYMMFLNVVDLYQDQGGNILNIADNLLRECTRTEKTLADTLAIGTKHLTEFIILWVMSIGILLFMRFSLKDFYVSMMSNPLIPALIFVFFFICILSINLFVNAFTNLTIKEKTE